MSFSSCKKKDNNNEVKNDIATTSLNKVLIHEGVDTLNNVTIFEIYKVNDSLHARIKFQRPLPVGDGGINYLMNHMTADIIALTYGTSISANNSWTDTTATNSYSLVNFKGKGDQYIGVRNFFFPEGVTHYTFGWLKINLSANSDTLKIIESATNTTENLPILAGQIK